MNNTQRAWAEIDLDNIAQNVREIKKRLKSGVRFMGVVKADAYGHGVRETAKTILENGADCLAVAFIDEAVQLRKTGITVPILILGNSAESSVDELLEYQITPAVFTQDFAKALSRRASELGKTAKIHIKVDTGMHRIGFLYGSSDEEKTATVKKIIEISKLPNIEIEGLFTHLSTSDEADTEYTYDQYNRFMELNQRLLDGGLSVHIRHIANSAALVRFPELQLDMVRAGVIMYGMYPSRDVDYNDLKLKPAMKFKTRVINVKDVKPGAGISYGRSYVTDSVKKIATIAVGYADGYSRILSGKADIIVDGVKVRQLGRICMDQCMIDVTTVNNINIGDEVTLFGESCGCNIPIEDVADKMGTINYEIACIVGKRIPRIYIKDGKPAKSVNYLLPEEGE
ncbi:MAG: alanine racemase [Clostridia bacterium]|nr:alanine racemase [Clostridia bacterium]